MNEYNTLLSNSEYSMIARKGGENANRIAVMSGKGLVHNPAGYSMGGGVEGGSPVASRQKCSPGLVYLSVHI